MKLAEFTVDIPLAAIDDDLQYPDSIYDYSIAATDLQGVFGIIESLDSLNHANNNNEIPKFEIPNDENLHKNILIDQNSRHNSTTSPDTETFSDAFGIGSSLEDLVSNFDEKISHCFVKTNLKDDTENIAPVQIRTQEEIMNESQIWWTLTGNFGNILPIDWSKNYARKLQLPALNLRNKKKVDNEDETEHNQKSGIDLDVSDDEELVQALDLHSLISSDLSNHHVDLLPQTADEVIEEIDEIFLQQSYSYTSDSTGCSDLTTDLLDLYSDCQLKTSQDVSCSLLVQSGCYLEDRVQEISEITKDKKALWSQSYKDLAVLHSEMETMIRLYNETLVQELAFREEMEDEKELKNAFVSLLTGIQNKRKQWSNDNKRKISNGKLSNGSGVPQYMTAIIPYEEEMMPFSNSTLERLIKILQAVHDDNPNVPNILTDYILKVICPTTRITNSLSLDL